LSDRRCQGENRVRQAQCDLTPDYDQFNEGIYYYCKTDNPVTRRSIPETKI